MNKKNNSALEPTELVTAIGCLKRSRQVIPPMDQYRRIYASASPFPV
jgi:hypothetical protein